jgi:hypothetical protein
MKTYDLEDLRQSRLLFDRNSRFGLLNLADRFFSLTIVTRTHFREIIELGKYQLILLGSQLERIVEIADTHAISTINRPYHITFQS